MSDSRGDGSFPISLRDIFKEPAITLLIRNEGLPKYYGDIPNVNVYDAPGAKGGDWKKYLKDKGAWIITPLHKSSGTRSKYIRKASGGGRWDDRTGPLPLKKNVDASWVKRKYILETKEGTGLPTYTMFEYSSKDKPTHVLCRITVDNKNIASSQQRESQEIYHTDSNNGDQGGNLQNAAGNYNLSDLGMCIAQFLQGEELSEFRKRFSKADILQVFSLKMDEIEKPDASPKEHSADVAVRKPRKRGRFTCTNTMEAGTPPQGKEQVKVQEMIIGLNATIDHELEFVNSLSSVKAQATTSVQGSHHSNYIGTSTSSGATFEQWIPDPRSDKDTLEGLVSSCSTHHDANYKLDDRSLVETGGWLDQQVFEQNVQAPHNFYNFNANSTEPMENRYYLPGYNQNIIPPGPTPTYYGPPVPPITDQGTYNASEEQPFSLCNTQHGQMFESNAYVLKPNNHNINAPHPSTSNWRTTVLENMNLINNVDLSCYADIMDLINNDRD